MKEETKEFLDALISAGGNDLKFLNGMHAGVQLCKLIFVNFYGRLRCDDDFISISNSYLEARKEQDECSEKIMSIFNEAMDDMMRYLKQSDDELRIIKGGEENVNIGNNEFAL